MKLGFDYPEKQVKIVTTNNQKNRKVMNLSGTGS
jgi:hypothetical protein